MISVSLLHRTSLAAVLFWAAATAQAAVAFHVTVSSERQNPAGTPVVQQVSQEADVVLGQHYLSVSDGKRMTVLDFAARRRYSIDMASAMYEQESLFGVVAMSGKQLSQQPKTIGALTAQQGEQTVLWSQNALPLLSLGMASQPVSGDDARAFVQFLRYTWDAQPQALKILADGKQIPARFTLYQQDASGRVAHHFRISGLTKDAPRTYTLAAYQPRPLPSSEPLLERVLEQATRLQPPGAGAHAAMRAQADQVFAARHTFEAFLMMLEDNLSTGALVEHLSPEQLLAMQSSEAIQQLLRALSAKDQDGITTGLVSVQALRAETGLEQPMLKFFEAGLLGKLGQWPAAEALYLEVLQVKPHLVGGWKDLGDALYAQGDMRHAWRSWDAGRALLATHRLFKSVDALEKSLLKDYPAYF